MARSDNDALAMLLDLRRAAFEDAFDHARDKHRFRDKTPSPRRAMRGTRHQDE